MHRVCCATLALSAFQVLHHVPIVLQDHIQAHLDLLSAIAVLQAHFRLRQVRLLYPHVHNVMLARSALQSHHRVSSALLDPIQQLQEQQSVSAA